MAYGSLQHEPCIQKDEILQHSIVNDKLPVVSNDHSVSRNLNRLENGRFRQLNLVKTWAGTEKFVAGLNLTTLEALPTLMSGTMNARLRPSAFFSRPSP